MSAILSETTVTTESTVDCLGVNAAFLQEIKDDNRFLDELLLATRDALAALAEMPPVRLNVRASAELLKRLRDRLAMHFSLEEAFGYVDGAIEFPPNLSERAVTCRKQHESLYLDVCNVVDVAEKLLYQEKVHAQGRLVEHLSAAFGHFYRRFRDHEADETSLISEAFAWSQARPKS